MDTHPQNRRHLGSCAGFFLLVIFASLCAGAVADNSAKPPRIESAAELNEWLLGTKWKNSSNDMIRIFASEGMRRGMKGEWYPFNAVSLKQVELDFRGRTRTLTFDDDFMGFESSHRNQRYVFVERTPDKSQQPNAAAPVAANAMEASKDAAAPDAGKTPGKRKAAETQPADGPATAPAPDCWPALIPPARSIPCKSSDQRSWEAACSCSG